MEINLQDLRSAIDQIYLRPEPLPAYQQGRSIVTTVYDKEFASGFVLLSELKRLGCQLPIEVFYRDGELSQRQVDILQAINPSVIRVRCLQGQPKNFVTPYGTTVGWSTKIYALLESSWAENLWIDSDNFPIKNPEFLFEDPEYLVKHCMFWRDVFSTDRANRYHDQAPIWPIFNVTPNDAEPFEAGQLLINKPGVWSQFNLVKHYADRCDIYYNFGGDTETFRMAWQSHSIRYGGYHTYINYHESADVPYGFMPYGPFHKGVQNQYHKWGGGTVMVQRDRHGNELFNHRNINKFNLISNVYNEDVANEDFYHSHVDTLKNLMELAW